MTADLDPAMSGSSSSRTKRTSPTCSRPRCVFGGFAWRPSVRDFRLCRRSSLPRPTSCPWTSCSPTPTGSRRSGSCAPAVWRCRSSSSPPATPHTTGWPGRRRAGTTTSPRRVAVRLLGRGHCGGHVYQLPASQDRRPRAAAHSDASRLRLQHPLDVTASNRALLRRLRGVLRWYRASPGSRPAVGAKRCTTDSASGRPFAPTGRRQAQPAAPRQDENGYPKQPAPARLSRARNPGTPEVLPAAMPAHPARERKPSSHADPGPLGD